MAGLRRDETMAVLRNRVVKAWAAVAAACPTEAARLEEAQGAVSDMEDEITRQERTREKAAPKTEEPPAEETA